MSQIKINNIDCYYEIYGSGQPLVLIAGLASDSQSWQPVVQGLAEHFQIIIFDNRGIGRTCYPEDNFDIATLARDTVALLDALKIDRANILGHSMGGCIAQKIAAENPTRVRKLILVNTFAAVPQKSRPLFDDLLKILDSGTNYELFIREFFQLIFTREYLQCKKALEAAVTYAVRYPYPVMPEGFRRQLVALNGFDAKDLLSRITAPTLIMAGKEDILVGVDEAKALAEKIPSAKTLYVEKAGHAFQIEQPDFFVKNTVDFLS